MPKLFTKCLPYPMTIRRFLLIPVSLTSLLGCNPAITPTPQPSTSASPPPSALPSATPEDEPDFEPSVSPSIYPVPSPSVSASATSLPTAAPTVSTGPVQAFDTDEPCASAAGVTLDQSPWLLPCTEVTTLNIVSAEPGISDEEMKERINFGGVVFNPNTQSLLAKADDNQLISLTEDKVSQTWKAKVWLSLDSIGIPAFSTRMFFNKGSLFLTNPDNDDVYRIDENKKGEVFFSPRQQNPSFEIYSFSLSANTIYIGDNKEDQIIQVNSSGQASVLFKNANPSPPPPFSPIIDGDLMTAAITTPRQVVKNIQGEVFYHELHCVRRISDTEIKTLTGLCDESTRLNSIGLNAEEKEQTKNARFGSLFDMEINTKGELILLDYEKGKLYKMEPYGHTLLLAGIKSIPCEPRSGLIDEGLAKNDDFMADGNGRQSRFFCPTDIALTDDDQVMYVADAGNRAFRKVRIYYSSQARPQREDWVFIN